MDRDPEPKFEDRRERNDRRQSQDPLYSGTERRKGDRRSQRD
ncbi:hypothetical protein ACX0GZ_10180 [Sphingomonas aestuarii]